jgi:hypothetical protein
MLARCVGIEDRVLLLGIVRVVDEVGFIDTVLDAVEDGLIRMSVDGLSAEAHREDER